MNGSEIAIIGMTGRFPQADSVEELWEKLCAGVECISRFSAAELAAVGVDPTVLADSAFVPAGGAVAGIDLFDAAFFGFSPREAEITDPQQRIFLECAWEVLERAGYDSERFPGAIGVFVGVGLSTYLIQLYGNRRVLESVGRLRVLMGNDKDYLPTWVSYKLDLKGPSLSVSTACSSSLVAVHLACQSLLNGECEIALAGGVRIGTDQRSGYRYQESGILSPDGHCRAFDASARGTVGGNGAGVVVLKRLAAALVDGDQIYAVIKGSAVNNDGGDRAGYTAPSISGQARVIAEALAVADVDPADVTYVEAHGTGTALGDPIEVAALSQVFRARTEARGYCALGSIKTNLGHLDTAAGVAGLIKVAQALWHQRLPPSLHYETPNPQIDFASSPFYVNSRLLDWHSNGTPRYAGVSSFGIGGTNVHVVLEEAPPILPSGPSRPQQLLILSARTPTALERLTDLLADDLERRPDLALADVAMTLMLGRRAFPYRRIVVSSTNAEVAVALRARDTNRVLSYHATPGHVGVTFLLPGQGAQYVGMAQQLYATEPLFRAEFDRMAELFTPLLGLDLRHLLHADAAEGGSLAEERGGLTATELAQPALFAVEYALARLWIGLGIVPESMIGHSIGELVAACLAGVFTLEDAVALVAARGRLMQAAPPGAMLAVPLSETELAPWLAESAGEVSLAAINSPGHCTVSGPRAAITDLAARLSVAGIEGRLLLTSHAFHSPLMEEAAVAFTEHVRRVELRPPTIPYLSNLTGGWITAEEATDPEYWGLQLRAPVRFAAGVETLLAEPGRVFLEVGPGNTLSKLVEAQNGGRAARPVVLQSLRHAQDRGSDGSLLLGTLGRLWLAGVRPSWEGLYRGERRRRILLPTYPFERGSYWVAAAPRPALAEAGEEAALASAGPEASPASTALALYMRPSLETAYVAAESEVERSIAAVWESVLGIQPIGVHDNFFELGGHSLLLTQLVTQLRAATHVEVTMRLLAEAPTIAALALAVKERGVDPWSEERSELLPALLADLERRYEPFPLTDVQEAYWIGRSGAFELGNVATHQYSEFDLEALDLQRFARAWNRLVQHHEMLRAIVLPDGRQQILEHVPTYEVRTLDLRDRDPAAVDAGLRLVRQQMSEQVLPSEQWPLFEIRACLLDGGRARLHMSMDLLITDAWSIQLLTQQLALLYAQPELVLPSLEVSFRDYVLAEVAFRESEAYHRALTYWLERLSELPGAPGLPLVQNPEQLGRPRFVRRRGRLEEVFWVRLKERAARAGLTPSGVLLAAYAEVLAAWSKTSRFLLNLTLFNRQPLHRQINDLVGDFTSLVLLEVDATAEPTFEARARRLQLRLWDDMDHRLVSGVRVLRELIRAKGGLFRSFAPVVFTSAVNASAPRQPAGVASDGAAGSGLIGQDTYGAGQTPQVWLDHVVNEGEGELRFTWDAVEDLFPPGLIGDMFGAYCDLLRRLAENEEAWHQSERRWVPAGQLALRAAVNETGWRQPKLLLHELFAEQAAIRPEHPAVIDGEKRLSYRELGEMANRLGRRLRMLGARPNHLVAVVLAKGWEQAVAALGVLSAGAAYLPLDPDLPPERLRSLLERGEVELALTHEALVTDLNWPPGVRPLSVEDEEVRGLSADPLPVAQGLLDLAYVIFTSGSTGHPKGVMIDHRGAANTLLDLNERFAVGPEDRILALSALNFDLSVYDLFGVWAAGATVVMPEPSALREPRRWLELCLAHRVTIWNSVPALLRMLVDYTAGAGARSAAALASMRLAWLSGDWIPVTLPDQVRALVPDLQVVGMGGATEASIWSILYPIGKVAPEWTSIPYGMPMRNQRLHVLDATLEPCPVWVPGGLYIGGIGLARGYWRDEEQTRASFFEHPLSGERLYRTGDLGRYLPDGNIEFLGREDFQVKVQGYRIELGEIEAALEALPDVGQAVVMAAGDPRRERRLVAYVVPKERAAEEVAAGGHPEAATVREERPAVERRGASAFQILHDPMAQLRFKARQRGLRQDLEGSVHALARESVEDQDRAPEAFVRRSVRRFAHQPIGAQQLGELLDRLRQNRRHERPKYLYPSAGGLYPVQIYLYAKPGRVDGLPGGFYYYHPVAHHLQTLAPAAALDSAVYGENAALFERAGFALFLVAELAAIAPLYGEAARDFSLLEAGYIGQALMMAAPALGLGLCPIGKIRFDPLRDALALTASHEYLHGLLGGGLDPAQAAEEEQEEKDDYRLLLELLQAETAVVDTPARPAAAVASAPKASRHPDVAGLAAEELRTALHRKLPAYMVPAAFVLLGALPLTPNGKVDRKALPAFDPLEPEKKAFVPPVTELEREVARIWAEVLGVETVGLSDSFFELGGHSILAARLIARIRKDFHVDLPLALLFEVPTLAATVAALAREIGAARQRSALVDLPVLIAAPTARHLPFPLTDLQEAYWLGGRSGFELGDVAARFYVELATGDLDCGRFRRALTRLIDHHDMLRAVVLEDGTQRVLDRVPVLPLPVIDLAPLAASPAAEEALREVRDRLSAWRPSEGQWPLFAVLLSRLDEHRWHIHICMSLLVSDAWSTGIFSSDLRRLYAEPDLELPALEISFRDYVLAVRSLAETESWKRSLAYWRERLAALPPPPDLPRARSIASLATPRFVRRTARLEPERWRRLRERAKRLDLTPDAVLCTAFAQVLASWSPQLGFLLNVLSFNRMPLHSQVDRMIGNFSTTVLLEVAAGSEQDTFTNHARRLQGQLWRDLEHSQVSGVRVLRELRRVRGAASSLQVPVVFASTLGLAAPREEAEMAAEGRRGTALPAEEGAGQFVETRMATPQVWLDHQVFETGGTVLWNWDAVEDLFEPGLVADMFEAYRQLLERLSSEDGEGWHHPTRRLLPSAHQALQERANATAAPLPQGLLHEWVAARAVTQPQAPAILSSRRNLTYSELARAATALARQLRKLGARPNTLVAIVMKKGWEQIVAVQAVLLSGAAYLPVDPDLPRERLWYLLEQGEATIILTQPELAASLDWPEGIERLVVEAAEPVLEEEAAPLASVQGADDLAYVIFTSGSTGMPKGVMIDHRAALNTIADLNHRFAVRASDRVLALSSLSFDLSVYDIFGLLAAGGTIVLPAPAEAREPARWVELMQATGVTIWDTVPALAEMLADHLAGRGEALPPSLRLMLLSGDWIGLSLPPRLRSLSPTVEVVGLGGATEAAIWSICFPIAEIDPSWKSIPYGRPLTNQRFYVLDEWLDPCPVWVAGDLYIAGSGLARGYWRDEVKTQSRFFLHPRTGERLYRTGDRGRYLADGNLEFLGREDLQVKIQGYRIELGEIEAVLARHPGVRLAAAVALGETRGSKVLAAYFVPEPGRPASSAELRDLLASKLPGYMVPRQLVAIDEMPLTSNGKIDRQALCAKPSGTAHRIAAGQGPRDELELELLRLWEEILEMGPVGVAADFFELGGHSLQAVRLMAEIGRRFGQDLPLSVLLEGATVASLAALLRAGRPSAPRSLVAIQPAGSRAPLFWVHPVGGNVLCYLELSRQLGKDQPCYGLQVALSGAGPAASIEEMAAAYCRALLASEPTGGPIRVGGWSMGGVLTFAMALELRRLGKQVAPLVLIDANAPEAGPRSAGEAMDEAALMAAYAADLGDLAGRAVELAPDRLRQAADPMAELHRGLLASGLLPQGIGVEEMRRLFQVYRTNLQALANYRPDRSYPGGALLIRAASRKGGDAADLGWNRWVGGVLRVHEFPGTHYDLMRMPLVAEIARRVGEPPAPEGEETGYVPASH